MDGVKPRFFPELVGKPPNHPDYYIAAWQMRRDVIESWIAQGETSLPRLLARFLRFERHYGLGGTAQDGLMAGTLYFVPVSEDADFALAALERWHPAIIRGRDAEILDYLRFDLTDMLVEFADGVDTVLELGSGYGLQLFRMFHGGAPADIRYVGGEPTDSGRALAERLAALEPAMRFESVDFDIHTPDWSCLEGSRKALIFTSWSLMYADFIPDEFFRALAAWPGEATLVFCEPLGFQWGISHPVSQAQADIHENGGLNGDLVVALDKAVRQGLIEPLLVAKDVFARRTDPFDLMSVVVCAKPAA